MGYAGLPIAYLFSHKYEVVGFDLSVRRVEELKALQDRGGDFDPADIQQMLDHGTRFTNNLEELRACNFYVVVVPTPVDEKFRPDFACLRAASREVGQVLNRGDVVVFESTVYPGATEEICIPAIEEYSGLLCNEDFFVGYSPERINPGDKYHTISNMVKVTSGSTPEAAQFIDAVYASVLGKGNTWQASSIRVAEACKVVENTQRDVNIAFMNEIAQILTAYNIDTNEVIEAMNTKWNALGFRPGLVGGHCIGVDPYYLIERAENKGFAASLMTMARRINNAMPGFVVERVTQQLRNNGIDPSHARVLLLGFTFKENCPDVRNTRVYDIWRLLGAYTEALTVYDPWADAQLVRQLYGVKVCNRPEQLETKKFEAVVVCVPHKVFDDFDFAACTEAQGVVYDVKGFRFLDGNETDRSTNNSKKERHMVWPSVAPKNANELAG